MLNNFRTAFPSARLSYYALWRITRVHAFTATHTATPNYSTANCHLPKTSDNGVFTQFPSICITKHNCS